MHKVAMSRRLTSRSSAFSNILLCCVGGNGGVCGDEEYVVMVLKVERVAVLHGE